MTIDICGNLIYGTTSRNNRLDVLTDELRHFASEKHSFYYQPPDVNHVKYIKIDQSDQIHQHSCKVIVVKPNRSQIQFV